MTSAKTEDHILRESSQAGDDQEEEKTGPSRWKVIVNDSLILLQIACACGEMFLLATLCSKAEDCTFVSPHLDAKINLSTNQVAGLMFGIFGVQILVDIYCQYSRKSLQKQVQLKEQTKQSANEERPKEEDQTKEPEKDVRNTEEGKNLLENESATPPADEGDKKYGGHFKN